MRSPLAVPIGALLGGSVAYAVSGWVVEAVARGARAVIEPSGRSTPSRHDFSQADAAILRNRFAEAATLLEHHAMDDPHDPEAYIRLARLHRDHLRDDRAALHWFDLARATGALTPGLARLVGDEMDAVRARLAPASPHRDA